MQEEIILVEEPERNEILDEQVLLSEINLLGLGFTVEEIIEAFLHRIKILRK